jgi:folate-dependent phosphoribosylglycinamide formyltransferase PurN
MKKIVLVIEDDLFFYPSFLDEILSDCNYRYFVLVVKSKPTRGRLRKLLNGLMILSINQIAKGIKLLAIAQLRRLLCLQNSTIKEVAVRHKVAHEVIRGKLEQRHRELFTKDFCPDLIFSASNLIIPDWMLSGCRFSVNMHFSKLPKYGGVMPIFHAVANKEIFSGITLHNMTSKIDCGDIFSFLSIEIDYKKSLFKNYQNFFNVAPSFVLNTMKKIMENNINRFPQAGESSYHSWPTSADWRKFKNSGMLFF